MSACLPVCLPACLPAWASGSSAALRSQVTVTLTKLYPSFSPHRRGGRGTEGPQLPLPLLRAHLALLCHLPPPPPRDPTPSRPVSQLVTYRTRDLYWTERAVGLAADHVHR